MTIIKKKEYKAKQTMALTISVGVGYINSTGSPVVKWISAMPCKPGVAGSIPGFSIKP